MVVSDMTMSSMPIFGSIIASIFLWVLQLAVMFLIIKTAVKSALREHDQEKQSGR